MKKIGYQAQRFYPPNNDRKEGFYGDSEVFLPTEFGDRAEQLRDCDASYLLDVPEPEDVDIGNQQLRVLSVNPNGDFDKSKVVVRQLGLGEEFSPKAYAGLLAIAELLGLEVMALPSKDVQLTKMGRQRARSGDLSSISEAQAAALQQVITSEQEVINVGDGFGAQLALSLHGVLKGSKAVLIEPVNAANRGTFRLSRDLKGAGDDAYVRAIDSTNWPALKEYWDIKKDGHSEVYFDTMRHTGFPGAARAYLRGSTAELALFESMKHENFPRELYSAGIALPNDRGSRIVVARDVQSNVTSKSGFERAITIGNTALGFKDGEIDGFQLTATTEGEGFGSAVSANPIVVAEVIAHCLREQPPTYTA